MQGENPTADSGASITERLENFLAAEEPPAPEQKAEQPQEPEQQQENPDVEPDSGEPEEQPQPQYSTSDLAKLFGVDESLLDVGDDGNAIIKTKIDGKEGAAKLADVLKSYQLQGHIDNKSRAIAEQEKAIQARIAEVEQKAAQRLQRIDTMASVAQHELNREYSSINWQQLRYENPGEYAARQADFQQRQAQLNQMFDAVEQSKTQQQQQQSLQYQQTLAQEAQKLTEVIPEWQDAEVADKERKEIREYGIKTGIPSEELDSIGRASYVSVLRKAMLYDKLQESKASVENKVRTAPKLVKPGQPANDRGQQTVRNLKTQITKSGGKQGIAEYLLATGKA